MTPTGTGGKQERAASQRSSPGWLSHYRDVMAQWHPTRNGDLDPATLRGGSNRAVWWLCPRGHEWQARVSNRARRGVGCPTCAGQRATPDRSLAVLDPEVAETWHPTRNGSLTPTDVLPSSMKRVWWQCPAGHEWENTVDKRVKRRSCPFCAGRRVSPETSLAVVHPAIAQQWHPTRNGKLTPDDVLPGYNSRVWWLCGTCGNQWQARPADRTRVGSGCRECAYAFSRRAAEPLSLTHPEVAAQWHPIRNGSATADRITYGSNRRVWWLCPEGHEWETVLASRTSGKTGCPYCAGKRASPGRNLAVTAPGLAAQWHPTRNGALRPDEVLPGSAKPAWWLCAEGHSWQSSPNARQYGEESHCPYCSGRRVRPEASLAAVCSAVAAEWHPRYNGDLHADEVAARGIKSVWWLCGTCGHEWSSTVKNRTGMRTGCPRCALIARRGSRPTR